MVRGEPLQERVKSSGSRISRSLEPITPFFAAASAYFAACLTLGGGTRNGFLSDVVLQVLAVPLVLWAGWRLLDVPREAGGRRARGALLACLIVAALPIAQLVPLPPELWRSLPGRTDLVDTLTAAGLEVGWLPLSVVPGGTWLSALAVLPPMAVLLSVLQLDYAERRRLLLVFLIVGVLGAVLGLVQLAQGQASPWRFYAFTNPTETVGFFANRNHHAALLNCLLPITAAWMLAALSKAMRTGAIWSRRATPHVTAAIIATLTLLVAIAAQLLARSRAGLGLMPFALAGALVIAYAVPSGTADPRPEARRSGVLRVFNWLLLIVVGLALSLAAQSAFDGIRGRLLADLQADGRIPLARNTFDAAMAYMPFGSGMGTFVQIYQSFESAADGFTFSFVNRAHNDFLELWLETGLLGLVGMFLFLAWFARAGVRVWRRGLPGARHEDNLLGYAAALVLLLLLAHSAVDYPLRTTALLAVFASAVAMMVEPVAKSLVSGRPSNAAAIAAEEGVALPAVSSMGHAMGPSTGFRAATPPSGGWPEAWRARQHSDRTDPPG